MKKTEIGKETLIYPEERIIAKMLDLCGITYDLVWKTDENQYFVSLPQFIILPQKIIEEFISLGFFINSVFLMNTNNFVIFFRL